jgi:hypothetical protein
MPMKNITLSLALAIAFPLAGYSIDPSSTPPVIVRLPDHSPLAIRVKADYAEFPVMISTGQKETDYQLYELGEARKNLVQALAGNPKLKVAQSPVQFNAHEGSGSSFASYSVPIGQANVALRYSLPEGADLFSCAREVGKIVRDIPIPQNALYKYALGAPILGVISTEPYRSQLLKLIFEDANQIKSIFSGATSVSISGLSDAIKQHPVDDSHVELYLDYRISVILGQGPTP